MKAVILRPLAVFAITFFVFSCFLFTAGTAVRLCSAVIFSVGLLSFVIVSCIFQVFKDDSFKKKCMFALSCFLAGAMTASIISYIAFNVHLKNIEKLDGETYPVEATVTEVIWDGGYSGFYTVKIDKSKDFDSFKCKISAEGGLSINSRISCKVKFSTLDSTGQFDERRYYLPKGVLMNGEASELELLGKGPFSLTLFASEIRDSLTGIFIRNLGEDAGGFVSALMLGNDRFLPDTVTRDFQRLGLAHVLAISGMHLSVLCALVDLLLKPLGKRASQVGCLFTVLFYMFITGLSASVTRSGLMLIIMILASFFGRSSDRFTNLGVSVFIICLIDPYSGGDIGLQLSFAAVMAILLLTEKRRDPNENRTDLKKNGKFGRILLALIKTAVKSVLVTVVVILFMLPLEWLYFGKISVISPLTSPLFSFLCTLLIWVSPILLMLSPAPTFAGALSFVIEAYTNFICSLAEKLSSLRNITVSVEYPFAAAFCFLIFVSVVALCVTRKKKRLMFLASTFVFTIVFALSCIIYNIPSYSRAGIDMINYKKSDGILIVANNKTMLIDISDGHKGILREGAVEMGEERKTEIEVLMLTHLHSAHVQSLDKFLSEEMVRAVLLPFEGSEEFTAVEKVVEDHNAKVLVYERGDTVKFEGTVLQTYENTYIKRSVQPILRIDINAYGETFTYVSSAYMEGDGDRDFKNTDHLWFGNHGPLYRETYKPKIDGECRVYAEGAASQYIDENIKTEKIKNIYLKEN